MNKNECETYLPGGSVHSRADLILSAMQSSLQSVQRQPNRLRGQGAPVTSDDLVTRRMFIDGGAIRVTDGVSKNVMMPKSV